MSDRVIVPRARAKAFTQGLKAVASDLYSMVRFDGWSSIASGLGGLQDKRLYGRMRPGQILDEYTLATLYHHDWLARTICEILPEKGMRGGYELSVPDAEERETAVDDRLDETNAWAKLCTAAIWGRLYGAGAVLCGLQDGQSVDQPVNESAIERVNYLVALDRRSLAIVQWYEDPNDPKFGEPELYRLQRRVAGRAGLPGGEQSSGAIIHETRLVMFGGARTGDEEKVANQGWDYSVLQAVYDEIRDWGMSWAGASTLLQEASQAVYGVKDLNKILAREGGESALQQRFRLIEMARSMMKALVIDADGETFERKATTFTGIPDMLTQFSNRMAAATRIPVTILMGQAPAGLNATGESDLLTFQSTVEEWQTQQLAPRMERLVKFFLLEGGQQEPESWKVTFRPGTTESPANQAARRKVIAETDAIYVNAGVVLPEEIGLSRFAPEGWSAETQIDIELRQDVVEKKEEGLREAAEAGSQTGDLGTAGAQVEALDKITAAVATGQISIEAGIARVVTLFGMTATQAKEVLGKIEVKEPEPPVVVAPGGAPLPGRKPAPPKKVPNE